MDVGCSVFETALGWIGLAWDAHGITHVQLSERDRAKTAARIETRSRRIPRQMPASVQNVADDIVRYASGERVCFTDVKISLGEIDAFRQAIYDHARRLAHGETTTYGGLAAAAGYPGMARETGQALGANPVPIIVPCHRIVAAGGRMGCFSAPGGVETKRLLLDLERARPAISGEQSVFAF